MTDKSSRSLGAILGVAIGLGITFLIGSSGIFPRDYLMIPGAFLGAGGAVAGSITGEKTFAWLKKRS